MLTTAETDYVVERLLAIVAPQPSPRATLVAALYPELQAPLGEGAASVLVPVAIELCINDGYRNAPPAIIRLLSTLLGNDPRVVGIIDRVRTPPPAAQDPFDALILTNKMPFLDRGQLRTAVRELLQQQPRRPVIVVNSGAQDEIR